jgi:hypothetical protein
MFKLLWWLVSCVILIFVGNWVWNEFPELRTLVLEKTQAGNFMTLEARYTPEQLMNRHKGALLPSKEYAFLTPRLHFSPYLLMDVKYVDDKETGEGIILWSLEEGEMVINTKNWDMTHGFEDCINVRADKEDLKIVNALSKNNDQAMSREELVNELYVEGAVIDKWLASCRKKHLVIQVGSKFRLHFENPKILVMPETSVNQWLVTKNFKGSNRRHRKYNETQIKRISQAAFGPGFTIRTVSEVFLPIYEVRVKNPDNSVLTTYWNAISGHRLMNFL